MISCVIPAGADRPLLLSRAVDSLMGGLDRFGYELVVDLEAPSCGAGWNTGAARATGEYLWLLSDDVELLDTRDLGWALEACDAGEIICPAVYWPSSGPNRIGLLQGAGGYGLELQGGAVAANCIFPLMHRDTWSELAPVPDLNHYCDVWVTEWAHARRRGPVVTRGLRLSHAVVSDDRPGELEAYHLWRTTKIVNGQDALGRGGDAVMVDSSWLRERADQVQASGQPDANVKAAALVEAADALDADAAAATADAAPQ